MKGDVLPMDSESIASWYQRQTIFLSGGSGFLGKALLFKLLQCGTPRIYVLIRPKKGQDPEERLDAIVKEEIFESLTKQDPDLRSKLVAVRGDVTEVALALSEKDRVILQDEVTVVFHVAASVKFDDSLKKAVHHNLRSTRDMIELAKGMKNLKMFHHISTAYSNCDHMMSREGVEEKIYDRKMDWKKVIEFVDTTPEEVIASLEMKILGASPNTYIFTKHLSEAVVSDAAPFIPVLITRPAIVISGWKEPVPGWIDNMSSPVAIVGATGKGVLRLYLGTGDALKSYVAVDTCVNCCMASTWREVVFKKNPQEAEVPVININSFPMTTGQMKKRCFELISRYPTYNAIWHTHFFTINNPHLFLLGHLLLHVLPGIFFDILLQMAGLKIRLLRIYRKLYIALVMLYPLLNTADKFVIKNYHELKKVIPEHERDQFNLDVPEDEETHREFAGNSAIGFRKYLGDPPFPTKADFIHQKRLLWLDRMFRASFVMCFIWFFPYGLVRNAFESSGHALRDFINSL